MADKTKGVLIDITRCIGCRGCQVACKQWNKLRARRTVCKGDLTNPPGLNSDTYTLVRFVERAKDDVPAWDFIKIQCMHCKDPACASVCPVSAIQKTEEGPVVYLKERCIGCRYCMIACPFQVPKYEWEKTSPFVQKCTFCSERILSGRLPACVKVCPTKTILFGNYRDIVVEAERRLRLNPGRYVNHIYGRDEAGGTSWLYLSDIPFEELGFNTKISTINLPSLTWASLSKIPYAVGGLFTALSLIAYFRSRGSREQGS
jgi:formate dehydrogenase iron-sulfur subunit